MQLKPSTWLGETHLKQQSKHKAHNKKGKEEIERLGKHSIK